MREINHSLRDPSNGSQNFIRQGHVGFLAFGCDLSYANMNFIILAASPLYAIISIPWGLLSWEEKPKRTLAKGYLVPVATLVRKNCLDAMITSTRFLRDTDLWRMHIDLWYFC